jgi:hypothetical protein
MEFSEAMAGSLSVASTAVSSAKVVVVDSGEVGRSAVYSRYNKGPRTPWSESASELYRQCLKLSTQNSPQSTTNMYV